MVYGLWVMGYGLGFRVEGLGFRPTPFASLSARVGIKAVFGGDLHAAAVNNHLRSKHLVSSLIGTRGA